MLAVVPGFLVMLSLILAIGAQNVFVLRQGVRREHVGLVVVICADSDAVLVAAGVAGLGRLVEAVPWLVNGARLAGAVFLLGYAALAARRAVVGGGELTPAGGGAGQATSGATVAVRSRTATVAATAVALTWLNPHVYLDTVLLIGSLGAQQPEPGAYAAGAASASFLWFSALALGAAWLALAIGLEPAVTHGVLPFLLGAVLKSALGAATLMALARGKARRA